MTDKVVVVGKDSPSFELPAVFLRYGQQTAMEDSKTLGAAKMVDFIVGAGRDDEGAAFGKLVRGGVRPRDGAHGGSMRVWNRIGEIFSTPKRRGSAAVQDASAPNADYMQVQNATCFNVA